MSRGPPLRRPELAPYPRRPLRRRRASCLHPGTAHLFGALVERPARPRRNVERVAIPGRETLDPGPGDHRRIVGAQPSRRAAEAAIMGPCEIGEPAAACLVGAASSGDTQRGGIALLEREAGAVDEAVDHRLLKARSNILAL